MQNIIDLVDELTYRSYKFNRENSPKVKSEQWVEIYGKAAWEMEARYLREKEMLGDGVSYKDLDRWINRSE